MVVGSHDEFSEVEAITDVGYAIKHDMSPLFWCEKFPRCDLVWVEVKGKLQIP